MICSISGGASRQFTGRTMSRSLANPYVTSKNSTPFFSTNATLSPKPDACGPDGVGGLT